MKWTLVLVLAAILAAQLPRFDARTRLVMVPVNVKSSDGHDVAGLEPSDFLLFDNGRPQKATVDTIDTGVAPIALIVAVQSSGISSAAIEKVRKIGGMIQPLITGQRGCGGILTFNENITWVQECTKNADTLERAFRSIEIKLRPGEDKEAHLLDAVHSAVEHLSAVPNARRVLLLISESRDRGSDTTVESAVLAAQKAGVAVYSATYSAFKETFTAKGPVADRRRAVKPKGPADVMGTPDGLPQTKGRPKTAE